MFWGKFRGNSGEKTNGDLGEFLVFFVLIFPGFPEIFRAVILKNQGITRLFMKNLWCR
jgi:hypothetical protein